MDTALEKRWLRLQEKQQELKQKIAKVEKERAIALRKIHEKKARLIGHAILEFLAQSPWAETVPLTLSENDILTMLDAYLVSKNDRLLFGLETDGEQLKTKATSPSLIPLDGKTQNAERGSSRNNAMKQKENRTKNHQDKHSVSPSDSPVNETERTTKVISVTTEEKGKKKAATKPANTTDRNCEERKIKRLPESKDQRDLEQEFNL